MNHGRGHASNTIPMYEAPVDATSFIHKIDIFLHKNLMYIRNDYFSSYTLGNKQSISFDKNIMKFTVAYNNNNQKQTSEIYLA